VEREEIHHVPRITFLILSVSIFAPLGRHDVLAITRGLINWGYFVVEGAEVAAVPLVWAGLGWNNSMAVRPVMAMPHMAGIVTTAHATTTSRGELGRLTAAGLWDSMLIGFLSASIYA
jgi:hypothetical protein